MKTKPFEPGEAEVRFRQADYEVVKPGAYVRCKVTGDAILLPDLRYWNADHNEAYRDAAAALQRWRELQDEAAGDGS